jgi:hypothetical protein
MSSAKKLDPLNTEFMLLLKYRRPMIPLAEVVLDYLPHLSIEAANKRAAKCDLPFTAFKPDGNKSPYLVRLLDLASWLDRAQEQASKDWEAMH